MDQHGQVPEEERRGEGPQRPWQERLWLAAVGPSHDRPREVTAQPDWPGPGHDHRVQWQRQ